MADYIPRNSINNPEQKEEPKKRKPSIEAAPQPKKKTRLERIIEAYTPKDISMIIDNVIFDMIIPASKQFLESMGNRFLNAILFPNANDNYSRNTRPSNGPVYRQYYEQDNRRVEPAPRIRNDVYRYQDYEYTLREAECILADMQSVLDEPNSTVVTVADLMQFSYLPSYQSDENYGWTSLAGVRPIYDARTGKYYLNLPKPMSLQ